jgi:hypothetical protein
MSIFAKIYRHSAGMIIAYFQNQRMETSLKIKMDNGFSLRVVTAAARERDGLWELEFEPGQLTDLIRAGSPCEINRLGGELLAGRVFECKPAGNGRMFVSVKVRKTVNYLQEEGMKTMKFFLLALLALAPATMAAINFDTLTIGKWLQIPTSGTYPGFGVETHLAFDTSGNFYMLGACAYYGSAGGTHNNDIFRFQTNTGVTALPFSCGTNPWPGGCQGGQVFDPNRNCIWFGPGNNSTCRTGVEFFPNLNYYGGLYKMQCPAGRPVMIRTNGLSGGYYLFDPANNLVIGVADNNYWGCKLSIYDIAKDTITIAASPWNPQTYTWRIPTCFDTKRGRVVITRWGTSGSFLTDFWYYTTATKQWSKETPSGSVPPQTNMPLVYEPVADKYVLIGSEGTTPFVWVYDPVTNAWTDKSAGGGAGPFNRVYPGSFGYSVKDGVIANWGGLNTSDNGSADGNKQAIWVYKFAQKSAGTSVAAAKPAQARTVLTVSPNPFKSQMTVQVRGLKESGTLRIFTVDGREVAVFNRYKGGPVTWNAGERPAGVYLVELKTGARTLTGRALLVK